MDEDFAELEDEWRISKYYLKETKADLDSARQ
jgi:hypothetical protein